MVLTIEGGSYGNEHPPTISISSCYFISSKNGAQRALLVCTSLLIVFCLVLDSVSAVFNSPIGKVKYSLISKAHSQTLATVVDALRGRFSL